MGSANLSAAGPPAARNPGVDSARGIACLLLVAFHVIGATPEHGIRAADDSLVRAGTQALGYLRMPLFTFLSGVVYALAPVGPGAMLRFAGGKARRIVLPFVVATGFYLAASALVDPAELIYGMRPWVYLVYPFMHLWFLPAITVIFILVAIADRSRALATPGRFAAVLGLAVLAMFAAPFTTGVFSINRALQLLPFFLLGLSMTRFPALMLGRPALLLALICAGVGAGFALAAGSGSLALSHEQASLVRLALGAGAPVAFLNAGVTCGPLAWIGRASFAIYLYHVAAIGAARRLLHLPGLDSTVVLFVVPFAAGVFLPMLLEWVAAKFLVTRLFILGLRPRRPARAATN